MTNVRILNTYHAYE